MIGQFIFDPVTQGIPGQPAGRVGHIDTALYPARAQVTTLTVGDATPDDGTYTVRITLDDGRYFDASFVASSDTDADLAAGLATAINAVNGLRGIVTASAALAVATLTFSELGQAFAVTMPSNPGSDVTVATATDASVPNLTLGIGVVTTERADGALEVRAPTAGDTTADIHGFTVRSDSEILPRYSVAQQDGFAPGGAVPLAWTGDYWCDVEAAVSYRGAVFVRCTAGAGEVAGALRGDSDGGDAVPVNAMFLRSTSGRGRTIVRLFGLPGASQLPAASLVALTDSTGFSGTHNDTLAATTVPADLTGGESPTEAEFNALLAVIRVMAQNDSDIAQKVNEIIAGQKTAGQMDA